jgi:hypothetical protein
MQQQQSYTTAQSAHLQAGHGLPSVRHAHIHSQPHSAQTQRCYPICQTAAACWGSMLSPDGSGHLMMAAGHCGTWTTTVCRCCPRLRNAALCLTLLHAAHNLQAYHQKPMLHAASAADTPQCACQSPFLYRPLSAMIHAMPKRSVLYRFLYVVCSKICRTWHTYCTGTVVCASSRSCCCC